MRCHAMLSWKEELLCAPKVHAIKKLNDNALPYIVLSLIALFKIPTFYIKAIIHLRHNHTLVVGSYMCSDSCPAGGRLTETW